MNFKTFKGQVLILISGLYFAVGVVLFFTNARNDCKLWFGKNIDGYTGIVMLISAIFGVVAFFVFKLLLRGIKDLRIGRLQARLQRVEKIDKTHSQVPTRNPGDSG